MTQLQENLERVRANVAAAAEKAGRDPRSVRLLAVSKTFPLSDILEAHEAGQLEFGENRVQELETKVPNGTSDIIWHLIGHLQSNKAEKAVELAEYIHSVDSVKLLNKINAERFRRFCWKSMFRARNPNSVFPAGTLSVKRRNMHSDFPAFSCSVS